MPTFELTMVVTILAPGKTAADAQKFAEGAIRSLAAEAKVEHISIPGPRKVAG